MRKTVYKNRYISVERDTFRVRGKEVEIFREVRRDAVVIVPRLRDGRFLLERQRRHALGKMIYEFPAGHVEKGETPRSAAVRELEEETGYRVRKIAQLSEFYWIPGSSSVRLFFFRAEVEEKGKRHLDDTEEISLTAVSRAALERMVRGGRITDGKTVLAFLYYLRYATRK